MKFPLMHNVYESLSPQAELRRRSSSLPLFAIVGTPLALLTVWQPSTTIVGSLAIMVTGIILVGSAFSGYRRSQRRGPMLSIVPGGVAVHPYLGSIWFVLGQYAWFASMGPLMLISYLIYRDMLWAVIAFMVISCLALLASWTAAYRPGTIHRGPIMTLTPEYFEIHPMLADSPVRFPCASGPRIVHTEVVKVKHCVIKQANITTTGNETPMTIDITCLNLTAEQLQRVIGCFACRPQYRNILATTGGVDLVRTLVSENPVGWPA